MIKPYPKYKDTNVSWLSNLPEHWETRKLSRSIKLIGSGTTPKSGKDEYYKNGTINWLLTGDLNDSYIYNTSKKITPKAIEDYSTLKNYPKGSIVMAMYGATIGKLGILKIDSTTNQACCVLSDNELFLNKFIYYHLLAIRKDIINLSFGGGQPNISQDIIKSLKLSCPPIEEQDKIVDFLDKKTQEIDQSISDKKQLVQLYEEEKQAIINNAVTKGLDSDTELKETGVEWLGYIPKHWKLTKIKYSSYLKARVGWKGLKSDEFLDDGYAYLVTGTDFKNGKIDWSDCHFIDKDRYEEDKFIQLQNNDLLITKDGTIGKLAIVENLDGYACLNSGVFVMRPLNSMYQVKFLYYILSSKIFESFIDYTSTGATILHLYQNVFNEFQYPLPTVKEQNEIIGFIEKSLTKVIDKQLAIEKEIELLKEYKQALIYEAVTGKIDVRDKITD
ncbi:restriction endonuclease subunit S [Gaetbulibacter sp. NE]|uniref:restriction endonuclease subunit S n=1 Tax=Gaetbulibacter sp. NE TaxID=2982307 RepID=UPI0021D03C8E|nr:restriction endonuclease subunit S [Gaetbulibacter sp. NE]